MLNRTIDYRKKVLIFIVAYNAGTTIQEVLSRIPGDVYQTYETHILIIDDSSDDKTFEISLSLANACLEKHITVMRNPENQGYGGNQKIGYNYARSYGYDIVVLLHGDAQYAPECMMSLIGPIADDKADVVFGSRMLRPKDALKGRMPLYKFVGNKILTTIQNTLMGVHFSEWHTGYRAYRVSALNKIPFEYNDNGFSFDTDIILQMIQCRARICEVPIPTHYGNEICRVNGLRYAFEIFLNTLRCKFHNMNLFYERRYDCCVQKQAYPLKLGYSSSHSKVIDLVKENSCVLDIGCGEGLIARELVKKGCQVVGIDSRLPADRSPFEEFIQWQFVEDTCPWVEKYHFDYVLLMDVIEHMVNPERFLELLRNWLQGSPCVVIISSSNIAFILTRLQLLFGRFNYVKRGILDMTHVRLFTCDTLKRLIVQSGYKVLSIKGIPAPFPEVIKFRPLVLFLLRLNEWFIIIFRNLFSYQTLILAKPYANLDSLLSRALECSAKKKEEKK